MPTARCTASPTATSRGARCSPREAPTRPLSPSSPSRSVSPTTLHRWCRAARSRCRSPKRPFPTRRSSPPPTAQESRSRTRSTPPDPSSPPFSGPVVDRAHLADVRIAQPAPLILYDAAQEGICAVVDEARTAGWYADPTGRFQYRYWDGATWTDETSSDGEVTTDPLFAPPVST